ncbi:MAG: hypothetical protein II981_11755 [Bacteroidales bacterium]|nr:hypothetical protein [Bacteroidales bacterium]
MKKTLLILAVIVTSMMFSCNPEEDENNNVLVTTGSVSDITETSAKCGGTVTASGYSVGSCGLCYSETPNPTVSSYITSDQIGTGTFTSTISGLEPGTKYYVRAYATAGSEIFYGGQKEFTTLGDDNDGDDDNDDNGGGNGGDDNGGGDEPTTGTINGHEWVDLGLPSGLKWATYNVGASSKEDYGDYFAWGETETKSTYTDSNSTTYEVEMSNISGNSQYDAATANWGSTWRMPTEQEMNELVDNCEWEWTQVNGVNGSKIIGPNGNFIFLPAAGNRDGSSLYEDGVEGSYWSSTPYNDESATFHHLVAFNLVLGNSYAFVTINNMSCNRYCGQPVRPVSD